MPALENKELVGYWVSVTFSNQNSNRQDNVFRLSPLVTDLITGNYYLPVINESTKPKG